MLMTKNRKAVLMHSPATGLWFYVGTRACYWRLSASLSKGNKQIPPRCPPPGFVSAFTLAHAICSWCQISGTSGAKTNAKTHLDLGKHLEGHSHLEHPRLGSQAGAWHSPTTCPTAPNGQHSRESHLQVQSGSAPSSTTSFLGRRIWTSEEVRSPSRSWGLLRQAGENPVTPYRAAPHNQPSCLLHQSEQGTSTWLVSLHTPGMAEELVENPWEQAAHGAEVHRKPLAAFTESQNSRGRKGPLWVI